MNILYHQYGTGNDYGADHHLTNNWDPDFDYGNEYVNVYFNIDTPSYDADCSFEANIICFLILIKEKKWDNLAGYIVIQINK